MLSGAGVVAATFGLWTTISWSAARSVGVPPSADSSWSRWDSRLYLEIARSGYTLTHCGNIPHRRPTDYCGPSGWFPGYPYLVRALAHGGLDYELAGRLLAVGALIGTLCVLWFGFLRHRPLGQGLSGMALAAVFPGAVYYGALFPVSLVTLATMGTLLLMQQQRWLWAGACGMVAAAAYPSGVLLAAAAVVPLLTPSLGSWRRRTLTALAIGGPIVGAYGLVLFEYQRTVGHWDAWFKVQKGFGHQLVVPAITFAKVLKAFATGSLPRWTGAQSLLVVALLILAGLVVYRSWAQLALSERAAVVVSVCWWVTPLSISGGLALYRADALVLPIVIIVVRARPRAVYTVTAAAAVIAYFVARLFFTSLIV